MEKDEGEKKDFSKTVFVDAVEIFGEDGELTKEELKKARRLAQKEAERRKNTTWGKIKSEWQASKTELIKSFFKGVRGIVTAAITAIGSAFAAGYMGLLEKLGG